MSLSSVQQRVFVKKHGMKPYPTVRGYGILIGDALNVARVIAATFLSHWLLHQLVPVSA